MPIPAPMTERTAETPRAQRGDAARPGGRPGRGARAAQWRHVVTARLIVDRDAAARGPVVAARRHHRLRGLDRAGPAQRCALAAGRPGRGRGGDPAPVLPRRRPARSAGSRSRSAVTRLDRAASAAGSAERGQASDLVVEARMTSPIRGLGPNDVDLRGMILPARATAITSATVVGCMQHGDPAVLAARCARSARRCGGSRPGPRSMPHAGSSRSWSSSASLTRRRDGPRTGHVAAAAVGDDELAGSAGWRPGAQARVRCRRSENPGGTGRSARLSSESCGGSGRAAAGTATGRSASPARGPTGPCRRRSARCRLRSCR